MSMTSSHLSFVHCSANLHFSNHKLVYKDDHGSCSHEDESEKVWNVNVYLNSSELKIDIPIG